VWHTFELELINYQNKCRVIRGWDDLFTKVKEHLNSVTAMKLSPYYKVLCDVYHPIYVYCDVLLFQESFKTPFFSY
jgi:ornithine carbamoyltransferase